LQAARRVFFNAVRSSIGPHFPMFSDRRTHLPRRALGLISLVSFLMLAFGLYLQHGVGLEPCPMCIVQRYALLLVMLIAGLSSLARRPGSLLTGLSLLMVATLFGAFVAARQSWLQLYPPQIASCGRDFYGMIETFPLQRAIPMIFKGSGDCSKVDWTFLSLSIANWSFVAFAAISFAALVLLRSLWRRRN
jgi:disulfide bond formation protein DsbB